MKMVKSLLLGSAAGLVAVTAGQAADLPVKAKPVEYVKICSLYGAGFYYMPGTDMCIKIGGYVRAEITDYTNGNLTNGPIDANFNARQTSNLTARARGYITADARDQSAYGTIRAYIAVGLASGDTGASAGEIVTASTYANRAFVQWAGITAGLSQSFYDFYSAAAVLYRAGFLPASDTGDGGWWVWGYTAQLGNGVSATISAEQHRMSQIIDQTSVGAVATSVNGSSVTPGLLAGCGTIAGGTTAGACYGGWIAPDVIGNIRVDQAWGGAQIMAAAHEVNPLYYSSLVSEPAGHPSDKWGFAVGAGLRINAPTIGPGDYFQAQANYTQGALRYLDHGVDSTLDNLNGNNEAYGVISDCVYGGGPLAPAGNVTAAPANGTACQLTTAWAFNVSYEHYWTPQVHESFVGQYMAVQYDASANAMLCSAASPGAGVFGAGVGTAAVATPGCDNNWQEWGAGTRLQWDVTKTLYLGVEAIYSQIQSASTPTGALGGYMLAAPPTQTATTTGVVHDEHNWAFTARIHRDFLP